MTSEEFAAMLALESAGERRRRGPRKTPRRPPVVRPRRYLVTSQDALQWLRSRASVAVGDERQMLATLVDDLETALAEGVK